MFRGFAAYLRRHHLALLALFLALGGTSVAATNALLPNNSVGTAQLKKGAVTKKKIAPKTLKQLKGNKGAQGLPGAQGPQGPQGPAGAAGAPGAPGAPGTARAYALVDRVPSLAIDGTYVKGTGWAVVRGTSAPTGVYCVTPPAGINPAANPPIVTIEWSNSLGFDLLAYWDKGHGNCTAAQYQVRTYDFPAGGSPVLSNDISFLVTIP